MSRYARNRSNGPSRPCLLRQLVTNYIHWLRSPLGISTGYELMDTMLSLDCYMPFLRVYFCFPLFARVVQYVREVEVINAVILVRGEIPRDIS